MTFLGGQIRTYAYKIMEYQFLVRTFLSTGGTSTGAPVCLSVLAKKIKKKGLVIIVYTPVLSTTGSYWLLPISEQ